MLLALSFRTAGKVNSRALLHGHFSVFAEIHIYLRKLFQYLHDSEYLSPLRIYGTKRKLVADVYITTTSIYPFVDSKYYSKKAQRMMPKTLTVLIREGSGGAIPLSGPFQLMCQR